MAYISKKLIFFCFVIRPPELICWTTARIKKHRQFVYFKNTFYFIWVHSQCGLRPCLLLMHLKYIDNILQRNERRLAFCGRMFSRVFVTDPQTYTRDGSNSIYPTSGITMILQVFISAQKHTLREAKCALWEKELCNYSTVKHTGLILWSLWRPGCVWVDEDTGPAEVCSCLSLELWIQAHLSLLSTISVRRISASRSVDGRRRLICRMASWQ